MRKIQRNAVELKCQIKLLNTIILMDISLKITRTYLIAYDFDMRNYLTTIKYRYGCIQPPTNPFSLRKIRLLFS